MSSASTKLNRVFPGSGIKDTIIRPDSGIVAGKPVCLFLHGNGSDSTMATCSPYGHPNTLPKYLGKLADELDLTILAPTTPQGSFGNGAVADTVSTTAQGCITAGITYHRANLGGHATDGVVLLGLSMGSTAIMRRCGLASSTVACAVGFLAVVDLTVVVANDVAGFRDDVNIAYGRAGGDTSALPANTCPTHQMSDTVPKLITYGTLDGFSIQSGHVTATEWASGRGATVVTSTGGAHDDLGVSGISYATIRDFIANNSTA